MTTQRVKYQPLPTEVTPCNQEAGAKKWGIMWRVINFIMVVFFCLSAYVQINDPDPYIWIPAYAIPALLSAAIMCHPPVTGHPAWRTVCVVHIAMCVAGSLYLTAMIIEILAGHVANPLEHEEGRELGGTLIVLIWLCLCRFTSLGSAEPGHGAANAMLLMTGVLGCLPLIFWGLCFVEGLDRQLGHCKDMFPGMLGHSSG